MRRTLCVSAQDIGGYLKFALTPPNGCRCPNLYYRFPTQRDSRLHCDLAGGCDNYRNVGPIGQIYRKRASWPTPRASRGHAASPSQQGPRAERPLRAAPNRARKATGLISRPKRRLRKPRGGETSRRLRRRRPRPKRESRRLR